MIGRAREVHVLDYILTHEPSAFKRVGSGYRHKDDDAIAVNERGWYCHRTHTGKRSALEYLLDVKGYGFVDAVSMLIGEKPLGQLRSPLSPIKSLSAHLRQTEHPEHPRRAPLALPRRNKDNRRVLAYLQSRGIDRDLIMSCVDRGCVYESAVHHNAVFLGKDEQGKTRLAAIRSTTGSFMRDADGSDKRYGFTIPPSGYMPAVNTNDHANNRTSSNAVAIFESPIDALSHQTLCEQGFIPAFDGWRLSLGGVSLLALNHFLDNRPEISTCIICTDNDEAGNTVAAKIADTLKPGVVCLRAPPLHGKDYNDTLQAMQQTMCLEMSQTQTSQKDSHCI